MGVGNVKWVRLGDYISQRREKNNNYDVPIYGVTRDGFIPPKQKEADTSMFLNVRTHECMDEGKYG